MFVVSWSLCIDIFIRIAIWAVPVLFSIVVHEVAHGWVAYRLGDDTAKRMGRLTLNPVSHVDLMGTVILPLIMIIMRAIYPLALILFT